MLSAASPSASFLQSHANVNQFSERVEQNNHSEPKDAQNVNKNQTKTDSSSELAEQRQLQTLKTRDRDVRAHELAHVSVGGQYASSASFTYEKGSDGVLYAVAGEVSISTSSVAGDPRATLEKAQTIQRAALAPANPSAQDRSVAAAAGAMAQNARTEIITLNSIENTKEHNDKKADSASKSIDVYA